MSFQHEKKKKEVWDCFTSCYNSLRFILYQSSSEFCKYAAAVAQEVEVSLGKLHTAPGWNVSFKKNMAFTVKWWSTGQEYIQYMYSQFNTSSLKIKSQPHTLLLFLTNQSRLGLSGGVLNRQEVGQKGKRTINFAILQMRVKLLQNVYVQLD